MSAASPFDEMHNADGSIREPYLVLDQWLKELWLEGGGGGTGEESYELAAYAAGHCIDYCIEAQGRKGYAYFFTRVPRRDGKPQPNGATHTAEISYMYNHPYSNGPLE